MRLKTHQHHIIHRIRIDRILPRNGLLQPLTIIRLEKVRLLIPINAKITQYQLLPQGLVLKLLLRPVQIGGLVILVDGENLQFLEGDAEGIFFGYFVLVSDVDVFYCYLEVVDDSHHHVGDVAFLLLGLGGFLLQ